MVLGNKDPETKFPSENRWYVNALSKTDPEKVKEAMANPKTHRKAKIFMAINENIISVNVLARLIHWSDGSKICTVPIGLDAIDYLVDMSFLEEYSEVWKAITDKLNPAIPIEAKSYSPTLQTKSAEMAFVE